MWRTVETDRFVPGWHIEAICEHLEAVSSGKIKRLIINIPPRHMKSLAVSVFWPAWDWLHHPERRWLFSSYAQSLSVRDGVRMRRLLQSPVYSYLAREFVPSFRLEGDQNTKIRYDNSYGGYRLATSVEGSLTGEGGDIICTDDPHNVVESESDTKRQAVLDWWDESMSTRLSDPAKGAFVIIMQRVHEEDLVGHVLERESEQWDHLCLPARYEGENRTRSSLGFIDPRTYEGEPLWPKRFDDETLRHIESTLGIYATSAQLQQRPSPRGGGLIKIENFRIVKNINISNIEYSIRAWDKAGTEDGGARTVGLLMHRMKNGTYVISDIVKGQWSAGKREHIIRQTAQLDGRETEIWIEQEPGSGGKESAENTVRNLAGYVVRISRPTTNKVARAEPFAVQVESGNVVLLARDWTNEYIRECEKFPKGRFADQVDASSLAFNHLSTLGNRMVGTWGSRKVRRRKIERWI